MNGHCLKTSLVYKANVTHDETTVSYLGLCEGTFKDRFRNHGKSFRNRKYETETELSKYIWSLKDEGKDYQLDWSIVKRSVPYVSGAKKCDLCLTEKTLIGRSEPNLETRAFSLFDMWKDGKNSPGTMI